jgi:hypothetical protein
MGWGKRALNWLLTTGFALLIVIQGTGWGPVRQ